VIRPPAGRRGLPAGGRGRSWAQHQADPGVRRERQEAGTQVMFSPELSVTG